MKKLFIGLLFFFVAPLWLLAQPTYPKNGVYDTREGYYAFVNATIYTDYATRLDNATLIIHKGKIEQVGNNIKAPKGAVVIDLAGKYIYPSFIDLYTEYGLSKPKSSGQRTAFRRGPQPLSQKEGPYGWNQALKPEFNAVETFTTDDKTSKELRKLGFGAVLTHRMDGIARGSSALVLLGDERENEMIINGRTANHLSFSKGSSTQNYPSSLMGTIALLRQTYYDAHWYEDHNNKEEYNLSLAAWNALQTLPQIFEVNGRLDILRAAKLGKEFDIDYIIKAGGNEYQRIDAIKETGAHFIIPLNFPDAYDVEDPFEARRVSLMQLKHWELAPTNPGQLAKANITFALTTHGLKKKSSFLKNLQKAIKNGLSEEEALKALTHTPAKLIKVDDQIGTLQKGKFANFLITSGNVFDSKTTIYHNWVKGKAHVLTPLDRVDIRGTYVLEVGGKSYELTIKGSIAKPTITYQQDSSEVKVKHKLNGKILSLNLEDKSLKGTLSLSGLVEDKVWSGNGSLPNGSWVSWKATQKAPFKEKAGSGKKKRSEPSKNNDKQSKMGKIIYPFAAYGSPELPQQKDYLITNATVWTNEAEGILQDADVFIQNGKITQVGKDLKTPAGITVIDAQGKHVTPGIIDEHSHIAVTRGVNEGTQASSAEVRIGDVVNAEDINIYRQLAGGVTSAQLLHGSANPIGGQSAIIKLRWGYGPEEMKIKDAPEFIKFALGENVKQSNWGDNFRTRFPQTRMGVEQTFVDHFTRAKTYGERLKAGELVRRDLELDALLEILNNERFITCHSYVQSEINMLMKVAERFGFKVNTFTHILEGYKVADKMSQHGAGGSTFSDWWAYKYEVIDAIPYNGALMHNQGVIVAYNSDDAEMARRLNQEAAKAVKYGGVPEEEAFKFVTLNPAKLLHIDHRTGSLKKGKDADVVIWSDNPLSIYAKAEKTFVDGTLFYSLEDNLEKREALQKERARIIQKMLQAKSSGSKTQRPNPTRQHLYHCDDMIDEGP